MGRQEILEEARKLPAEEQELLARQLQQFIEEREAADLELSVEQYRELLARIEEHERNPEKATPWEVVLGRLKVKR
jgi:putative addiction module component (TIGR02574 family)